MSGLVAWIFASVHSVNWVVRNSVAAFAIFCETTIGLGLIIPGDTVVLISGTGVKSWIDFLGIYLFVLLGSLGGETLGFFLGKWFGVRLRASALGRRIGEKNWLAADAFLEARGGLAVALSRFLPVLHSVVPVVSGMSKFRYSVFIRWTALACSVWAAIYLGVGWILHRSYDVWLSRLKYGGLIFVSVVVVVFVLVTQLKKRFEKRAEAIIEAQENLDAERVEITEAETEAGLE